MFGVFKNISRNGVFESWTLEAWKPEFFFIFLFFIFFQNTWNVTLNRKCKTPLFYQTLFGNGKSNGKLWPWETELSTLKNGYGITTMTLKMEKIAKLVLKTLWLRIYLIDTQLNFALEFTYSNNTSNNNSSTGSFRYIV